MIVIKGADVGKQFELEGDSVGIGRDSANSIRLHDTETSRRHAEIRRGDNGIYRLRDLESANGTFVNTKRIGELELRSGDHVQIGQTILVYTAGAPRTGGDATKIADQIRMISRKDESPSEIVKTIGHAEGSRILARPDLAGSPWLQSRLANLGVMYAAIQAVSHILEIDPLLDRIMELIFQSVEPDRGCVMLRNAESGELEPTAVRYREGVDAQEKITISMTIIDHVLREGQGVLVTDAARDDRFAAGQSIVRFGIREAICVPMKGRHETLGALYLDIQSNPREMVERGTVAGKFTEDHLSLAAAIAHQAAMAVEETRYHQALVHAERLAAVGQTIAAVSHHIKNILQGLRSGSEILKMGMTDKDDVLLQKGYRILDKNQKRIYDLVLDMLSYSKEREPAIEPTDLNAVVNEVVELLRGRAEEHQVRIEFLPDANLPWVQVDPEGIHRASLNIVGNAIEAVADRENSLVGVRTLLEANGEWARIEVVDNGPGIPADKLDDVFRPFVSSKGAKGTGLGLPVSRKILREHGGDVTVISHVGRGSKFILRVPVKSPLAREMDQTSPNMPILPST